MGISRRPWRNHPGDGGRPGAGRRASGDVRDAAAKVAAAEQAGSTRKEAIALVAAELGLPRREVYDAVVEAKPR